MTIFSILAVISFVLNIMLLMGGYKIKQDFNLEVKHEVDDVDCLQQKMNELEKVVKSDKSVEEKFEEIENITTYCKGYLSGIKEHIPHQKIIL